MDVFDAADLLAIEEDSLSSSSSCSGSDANGSDETSSKPLHEDKEDPSSRPQHHSKLDDGNRLQARTTITKSLLGETAEDSDNDDSSEDDGFLESMITFQKQSTPTQDDNLQQQTIEEKDESDSGTKVSSNQPLNESIDAHKSFDANADDVPILLGDSISKWMTSHQALKEKPTTKQRHDGKERPTWKTYDGAISVQNVEGNDGIHISSTLRLSVGKKRKRQTVAGSEVAEATLEQLQSPGDTQQNDEKQQYCGIAAIAPDAERSNVGTMVDCLARYDPEKGAYVLEIVDLDVSGLTTTQLKDDGRDKDVESSESNELPAERAHSIIADPRSRAKQAAKQVKRLKQGRGKRSERKRPTSAPTTNNTESKK